MEAQVNPRLPIHWLPSIRAMRQEWSRLASPVASLAEWEMRIAAMETEMAIAKDKRSWTAGRSDLLHAAGRSGDELTHSNILAWLLSPAERHGLRGAFLSDLVRHTWGLELLAVDFATVRREVRRSDRTGRRIADVVVTAGPTRLVIENKVYSKEDRLQCEDLYRLWTQASDEDDGPERVLFVLLTRHGREPESVDTDEARAAWKGLAWLWVEQWLRTRVSVIDSAIARSTVTQYIASLRPITRSTRQ